MAERIPRGDGQIPDYIIRWFERQDEIVNRFDATITTLTRDVSSLTANVQTLTRNQEALFSRNNRPFQWAAFVAALSLVAVAAGLLIAPINQELARQHLFDIESMRHMEKAAYDHGRMERDLEWLKKLEDRLNNRLHSRAGTL